MRKIKIFMKSLKATGQATGEVSGEVLKVILVLEGEMKRSEMKLKVKT